MTDNTKTAILAGAAVAHLLAIGTLFIRLNAVVADLAGLRESVAADLEGMRAANAKASASVQKNQARKSADEIARMEQLRKEAEASLAEARGQVEHAAAIARADAVKQTTVLIRQLGSETAAQAREVQQEIGAIRSGSTAAATRITEVQSEVGSLKTQVAATRGEVDRILADLKRVTGDLGVQSGLIATNARELEALRSLGERTYHEFRVAKSTGAVRVADVQIVLRKADARKGVYSLDLVASGIKVEKRDRGVNEPVQFYKSRARAPHEIVVNEVRKDLVIGYLSAPREVAIAKRGD